MPSSLHEALLLLFQNRPELAARLLHDALGVELPDYGAVRVEASTFSDLEPAEYRADLVVTLLVDGAPALAIVLEVQLTRDARKRYTWPLYAVSLRARLRCDVVLCVVTPHADVAHWASEPIALGPGNLFTPRVLGPSSIPTVVSSKHAEADPELAVLSAMAHGQGEAALAVRIATAASAGLRAIHDMDRAVLYSDFIVSALGEAARKAFQMFPAGYQIQSELIRNLIAKAQAELELKGHANGEAKGRAEGEAKGRAEGEAKGRAEGEAKGRAEGEAKGRAEGEAKGRAEGEAKGRAEGEAKGRAEGEAKGLVEALLAVLDARGLSPSPAERERIAQTRDPAVLARWLRQAVSAASAEAALSD
ncbi:MAG: hypothetical protein QM756_06110 [Polyangiaceae bacterium]